MSVPYHCLCWFMPCMSLTVHKPVRSGYHSFSHELGSSFSFTYFISESVTAPHCNAQLVTISRPHALYWTRLRHMSHSNSIVLPSNIILQLAHNRTTVHNIGRGMSSPLPPRYRCNSGIVVSCLHDTFMAHLLDPSARLIYHPTPRTSTRAVRRFVLLTACVFLSAAHIARSDCSCDSFYLKTE